MFLAATRKKVSCPFCTKASVSNTLTECVQHTHFTNRCVFWSCPGLYQETRLKITFMRKYQLMVFHCQLKKCKTATVRLLFGNGIMKTVVNFYESHFFIPSCPRNVAFFYLCERWWGSAGHFVGCWAVGCWASLWFVDI